jgi:hypothetical protein
MYTFDNQSQMSSNQSGIIAETREKIQNELDTLMSVLEDIQGSIPEGAYLRGMNALGALHRHKQTALTAIRPGAILQCWNTIEEIKEDDEELYCEIMDVADEIVGELCGEDSSIYSDDIYNLVHRGVEDDVFQALVNYKPEEGNAGYETSPMVLHHAIQMIMTRIFNDTYHELEIVRPVSCSCGWRGAQGNWDKHCNNRRHQRWANLQREKNFQAALELARARIVSRRENGIVFIDEIRETPAVKIAREEVIATAELRGERVVYINPNGEMSWFH